MLSQLQSSSPHRNRPDLRGVLDYGNIMHDVIKLTRSVVIVMRSHFRLFGLVPAFLFISIKYNFFT